MQYTAYRKPILLFTLVTSNELVERILLTLNSTRRNSYKLAHLGSSGPQVV